MAGQRNQHSLRVLINKSIEVAKDVFSRSGLRLPEFAFWKCNDWLKVGSEAAEIRDCMLGWDVTDFGSGDFKNIGRTLFTLRNGRHSDPKYPKSYAEKFILDPKDSAPWPIFTGINGRISSSVALVSLCLN